jgi:hypothetical protein
MTFGFKPSYFGITALLFAVEVLIALFVKDNFVRPYVGDALVVILIYCFLRSFIDANVTKIALAVLVFAFSIEFLQYLNIVDALGLRESKLAATVVGTSFAWLDLVAYIAGTTTILLAEKYRSIKIAF